MVWPLLFIGAGLVGLWLGSDLTVSCSGKAAWRARLPSLLIGLTIVSIGTSLPEITVSITGAIDVAHGLEASGVVIGDNIGSFMSQLLLVMALAGLYGTIIVPKRSVKREGLMLLISLAIFYLVCRDLVISSLDGYFLIAFYLAYNLYVFLKEGKRETDIGEQIKTGVCWREQHPLLDLLYLGVGMSLVIFASTFVVDGAIDLANFLNVDQITVGILVVGLGTSLPELVVSFQATRKGEGDISLGNVIGSNVTDLLFATGIGASITNLHVAPCVLNFDLPYAFLSSAIFLLLLARWPKIDRKSSSALLSIFAIYAIVKLIGK